MKITVTGITPTHKIACIKAIRTITGMGLVEARDLVNAVDAGEPQTLDVLRDPKTVDFSEYLAYKIEPVSPREALLAQVKEYAAIAPDMTLREFAAFLRVGS